MFKYQLCTYNKSYLKNLYLLKFQQKLKNDTLSLGSLPGEFYFMIISKINITTKTQLKWNIFTTTEQTLNKLIYITSIYHSSKKYGYSNCYRSFVHLTVMILQ